MSDIEHDMRILETLAENPELTQAGLAAQLGMAVGSVNWYIKRLIKRGWVKVSHLDRTRLQYDLTPEGMSVFTERAVQYAKDSLIIYKKFRHMAKVTVLELQKNGISRVFLEGDDEIIDILRLTCLEAGMMLDLSPDRVVLKYADQAYQIVYIQPV